MRVSIRGCREWIRLFIDLCGIVVVETIGISNSLRIKNKRNNYQPIRLRESDELPVLPWILIFF